MPQKSNAVRILGIDPGTDRLGYAIAEAAGNTHTCITFGCLSSKKHANTGMQLLKLERELTEILQLYRPQGAVVEQLFFSKNTRTAMSIAEARGMILTCLAREGTPIKELSPQHVKMGVTGHGNAPKEQVQRMVQRLFGLDKLPKPDDAADALALAFTGFSHFPSPNH